MLKSLVQVEQPQCVNGILRQRYLASTESCVGLSSTMSRSTLKFVRSICFLLGHMSKPPDTDRDDSESRPFQTPLNLVP